MNEAFRLSRIRTPRATMAAMLLLAVVFIAFGLLIYAIAPESTAATPRYFDSTTLAYAERLLGLVGGRES